VRCSTRASSTGDDLCPTDLGILYPLHGTLGNRIWITTSEKRRSAARSGFPATPADWVSIAIWALSGFFRVQAEEHGAVLRFGKIDRLAQPGLHYHWSYPIEQVLTPKVTRINRIDLGMRLGRCEVGGFLVWDCRTKNFEDGRMAASNRIGDDRRRDSDIGGSFAVEN
jgi:hypothetical protein